jgi:dCTP diphosphatase
MQKAIEEVIKINKDRDWDQFHSPENLAKSISIEAGELLECFQWSGDYDLNHVKEELADVVDYCILMANKLDLDLEEIVLEKLKESEKKYPVEKCRGRSTKYDKL